MAKQRSDSQDRIAELLLTAKNSLQLSVAFMTRMDGVTQHLEVESRLKPLMYDGGPNVVLQPIVELATGRRVGSEALSRFPADWNRTPDLCFHEAHEIGLGDRLELQALERA